MKNSVQYRISLENYKLKQQWQTRVYLFSSVQFSHSVVSDSLWPHGLQHGRPLSPSPTPRVYSNSCLLSWRCHPTISSSVVPFSHLQSFPASGSFWMSQLFVSGGQVLEFQLQHQSFQWKFRLISFRMDWLDLLAVQGLSKDLSSTTVQKHQFFGAQFYLLERVKVQNTNNSKC